MSLLTLAKEIAVIVNVGRPTAVLSDESEDNLKFIQFTQEAAEEIARRVDWPELQASTSIAGTGSNDTFSLPTDFDRLVPGIAVKNGSNSVRVGISADEWNSLTAVEGSPRYARLLGKSISFFPFMSNSDTSTVYYQSKNWCASGTEWGSDSEEALIPEPLIRMGAVWRWRRQRGEEFQDHMAEFEAAIADYEKFHNGLRSP